MVDGEPVLIPPLVLAQSSIYQRRGEYARVVHSNDTYVVYAQESTGYTNDFMIKEGYPNWFMLVYVNNREMKCRYKGELEMALQDDCIRWHLELSDEDPFYEVEKRVMINE